MFICLKRMELKQSMLENMSVGNRHFRKKLIRSLIESYMDDDRIPTKCKCFHLIYLKQVGVEKNLTHFVPLVVSLFLRVAVVHCRVLVDNFVVVFYMQMLPRC